MKLFLRWLKGLKVASVKGKLLDVGGQDIFWKNHLNNFDRITLLNLGAAKKNDEENFRYVVGDGCAMPFRDKEFQVAFSNSTIEHVSTWEKQLSFAREIERVSEHFWVQTPAYEFFMEPHYIAPFIHWLPKNLQKKLIRHFTLWGLLSKPEAKEIEKSVSEVRLLKHCEMKKLFPSARLLKERFMGVFVKSYIAVNY